MSAVIVAAATSCNKGDDDNDNDIFSDSGTTTPSGYVSEIKFTSESTNSYGVKEYETSVMTFTYDSEKRVKTWTDSKVESLENGGSDVYSETMTYYYEDKKITVCGQEKSVATTYNVVDGVLESDIITHTISDVYVAELDDNSLLLSALNSYSYINSYGESDNGIDQYTYSSLGDKIISYTRSEDDELKGAGVVAWGGGNTTMIGSDIFEFSTISNNQNIDLNMFVSNSEELYSFFDYYFGILTEVKGFHSTNMISSCDEEGYLYDILYVTDSTGRVIQAKWDKYGLGNYRTIYVSYFQ